VSAASTCHYLTCSALHSSNNRIASKLLLPLLLLSRRQHWSLSNRDHLLQRKLLLLLWISSSLDLSGNWLHTHLLYHVSGRKAPLTTSAMGGRISICAGTIYIL
jgi:hypothetical protein